MFQPYSTQSTYFSNVPSNPASWWSNWYLCYWIQPINLLSSWIFSDCYCLKFFNNCSYKTASFLTITCLPATVCCFSPNKKKMIFLYTGEDWSEDPFGSQKQRNIAKLEKTNNSKNQKKQKISKNYKKFMCHAAVNAVQKWFCSYLLFEFVFNLFTLCSCSGFQEGV